MPHHDLEGGLLLAGDSGPISFPAGFSAPTPTLWDLETGGFDSPSERPDGRERSPSGILGMLTSPRELLRASTKGGASPSDSLTPGEAFMLKFSRWGHHALPCGLRSAAGL